MQNMLERDPQGALDVAAQSARDFPEGIMVQEREAMAIQALMRLGRGQEAQERIGVFASKYPKSPWLSRWGARAPARP